MYEPIIYFAIADGLYGETWIAFGNSPREAQINLREISADAYDTKTLELYSATKIKINKRKTALRLNRGS